MLSYFALMSSGITPTLENWIPYLFSAEKAPMLAVGTLVGALFALAVFAVTVATRGTDMNTIFAGFLMLLPALIW